jgi:hypothetical protein
MDDLNKKGAGDRSKINMHEDYEVKYWTRQLGVSRDELEKRSTRLETRPQPFARNWAANAGWTKRLPDNCDKVRSEKPLDNPFGTRLPPMS